MKSRNRQRHKRRVKEEMLDLRDMCGIKDPTPYEAVKKIINKFENNERRSCYGAHTDVI